MCNCQKVLFLLIALGSLVSCNEEEKVVFANPTQIETYFPISDFLAENIGKLTSAEVRKKIRFNDETESVNFVMDSLTWRQEMDFFFQADINKAALAASYETEETTDLLIHQLKPGEKGDIKRIEVKKQSGKVVEIVILSIINNLFYKSTVEGKIIIEDEQIDAYYLSGDQKVWFLPGTKLQVEAEVI
ncbi:hypothetical protein [Cyclobacterium marinum]|uniref:Lipoprotein n=1 Tax=Cyclobacterium marinum (strain ATCC 25205 / DSM 745 / LMG 13164 / NCIMB 1802) TaxID=880070 RepID=G0IWX5_CYCMS|nr:hypothetical protein [Cyclobacterium marinum]AEL24893.1 hypothetical protein Cycma_1121 [Cyclobacterium marinum DSM 745]